MVDILSLAADEGFQDHVVRQLEAARSEDALQPSLTQVFLNDGVNEAIFRFSGPDGRAFYPNLAHVHIGRFPAPQTGSVEGTVLRADDFLTTYWHPLEPFEYKFVGHDSPNQKSMWSMAVLWFTPFGTRANLKRIEIRNVVRRYNGTGVKPLPRLLVMEWCVKEGRLQTDMLLDVQLSVEQQRQAVFDLQD